ncbi:MAG: glycosyltransferase family 4 protein, partial [Thermoplasmata archaeon]|nr:glycosyltransferase family 4 protein [Thermoplasmata archaeon]
FFLKAMEGFDAIVVSTRSYLEELIRAGFHGRAFQVYPYFDPREQGVATPSAVRAFRDRLGLGDDPIVLSVGRMDPVKRQDILIEAFATARRHHPKARLLLVGGGSFTTSTLSAGLGENKADAWLAHLHEVVRQRHLPEGAVVFAGGVSPPDLLAAYSASDLFVHPAPWEGFGLVVVEAWTHRLPVVVTRGAGVAELVDDELNGYVVPGESSNALARKIDYLLSHRDEAQRMGAAGALTARRCHVQRAAGRLEEVFERTIRNYENNGLRPGSLRSR